MSEFPKMLYKAGGSEEIWGLRLTTTIVADEAEQTAALADGFYLTVADFPAVSGEIGKGKAGPAATPAAPAATDK